MNLNETQKRLAGIAGALLVAAPLTIYDQGGSVDTGIYSINVYRGPEWLANLLYEPSPWLFYGMWAAIPAVIGLAYVGYRNAGMSEEVQLEVAGNGLNVSMIALAALLLIEAGAPYWLIVIGGTAGGYAAACAFWPFVEQAVVE